MLRRTFAATGFAAGLSMALPALSFADAAHTRTGVRVSNGAASTGPRVSPQTTPQTGHAPVNGLKLYYAIHGTGQPLVLVHGGVGAIEMFGEVLPLLARERQVIGVDLQGHGRTADVDRPLRFEAMADDVAGLL
jgi:alpha-beta hydrolase superfamily lysophospholipase